MRLADFPALLSVAGIVLCSYVEYRMTSAPVHSMANMKIGFIYTLRTYPPATGGSIHGYQLASNLRKRGHRLLTWYCGDSDNPLTEHFRMREVLEYLRLIDVLYIRIGWTADVCRFARLRWLRFRKLPIVWELNGLPEEILFRGGTAVDAQAATNRLRGWARNVDGAIGVTPRVREYLRDALGIANAYCIPNGSDPNLFQPRRCSREDKGVMKVVWMGNAQDRWHAVDTVLAAATILEKRHANICFEVFARRHDLPDNLPSNVYVHGVVPYPELGRRLGDAHVGLALFTAMNGCIKDGSPLKTFDYMASGLAIVGQNVGQTGEVVSQSNAGVFTTGEPEDLAKRLEELETDRQLCWQLGANGRQAVLKYYNWERVAEETEDVLLAAIGSRPPKRLRQDIAPGLSR